MSSVVGVVGVIVVGVGVGVVAKSKQGFEALPIIRLSSTFDMLLSMTKLLCKLFFIPIGSLVGEKLII